MVGLPLDNIHMDDLNASFSHIGTVVLWEKDPRHKGRIIVKVRVTKLDEIPKSVTFSHGDRPDSESWTFSVEVLSQTLLGGGPPDEDPLPDEGVDPHPLPAAPFVPDVPQPQQLNQGEEQDNAKDDEG